MRANSFTYYLSHRRQSLKPSGWCLLAGLVLLLSGCGSAEPPAAKSEILPVMAEPVLFEPIGVRVPTVGTVVAIQRSRVASRGAGRVVEFPLRIGALVKQGELLAQLQTDTLEIELAAAQALLKQREQEYAQMQAGYRAEELAQARARMNAADAVAANAEADANRKTALFDRGTITEEERDATVFEAQRAREAYAEARANFELIKAGFRPEEIEAARAAMEVQHQETLRLEEELRKRTITAPFDGYVVEKNVDVGEWIPEGGAVATVVALDEVEINVNVDESYIAQISVNQSVDVHVAAAGEHPLPGTIERIVPRSAWEQGSRSFPVVVRVKNQLADGVPLLKEGMLARINLSGPQREALLAHKDAIVRSSGKPLVFVIGADGLLRVVSINEGLSAGSYTEVHGELAAGDLLVTEGAERAKPFQLVDVKNLEAVQEKAQLARDAASRAAAGKTAAINAGGGAGGE